jgi:hypothetical protein
MSIYPTPTRTQGSIFNADLWIAGEVGELTKEYLEANFLEFPVSQGFETLNGFTNLGTAQFNNVPTCIGSYSAITPTDSSTNIPTTAWVQTAITAGGGGGSILATNNVFTGTNAFNNIAPITSSATMPSSTDSSTIIPTTAWVQTAISNTPPPVGGTNNPFFSASNVINQGQSITGGGVLRLQSYILFEPTALLNFDDNTAITIRYNYSIGYYQIDGTTFYQNGTQLSGLIDFYPTRVQYTPDNISGFANIFTMDNSVDSTSTSSEFGNVERMCWAYNTQEISAQPQMVGNNMQMTINKGSTGQVIIGLLGSGQTVPYDSGGTPTLPLRTTLSIEVINQGRPNPDSPIKITTPWLPPPPAVDLIWDADPSVLWGVNGFVSGGFGFGVYTP